MKRALPLILALFLSVPAHAIRLFTTGAEENNVVSGGPVWSSATGAGLITVTTPVYSGTYAFRALTSAAARADRRDLAASDTAGTYYIRFRLRRAITPSTTVSVFDARSSGGVAGWHVTLDNSNVLTLVNDADTSSIAGPTLTVDTWYRIEIGVVLSDTTGTLELLVDGASQGTLSSKDTLPTNIQQFLFGVITVSTSDIYLDDIAINDETGSFATSWPGDWNIALAEPGGDITNDWEDETAGASTYANVNEFPGAADDANYNVEAAALNSVDRFSLATLPAEIPSSATMNLMHVVARIGSNQTSAASGNLRVWDEAGSSSDGSTFSANVNGWKVANTAGASYPVTLSGKSKANVQDYDLGYINTTNVATRPRRVSVLWANVEWQPAAVVVGATRRTVVFE